jgi:glycosyltransferase involved in cell wall biosynthesis
LLEAMACRVPILATNTSQGAGELFRKNPLGTLVAKANADELTKGLLDRFQNPSQWLDRIAAAREYVVQNHSLTGWIDNISQQFIRIAEKP